MGDRDTGMTRREMADWVLRVAALPGAALFFEAWLKGAESHHGNGPSAPPPDPGRLRNYQPAFFSPEEYAALEAFTEILIPTDDTPGAREAQCAAFIDFLLQASGDTPQTQAEWRRAMAALRDAEFYGAGPERRLEIVWAMARPETDVQAQHAAYFAYRLIKQQTVFAFYTSRAGMIETLDYRGNSYNLTFPACDHLEHQVVAMPGAK